MRKMTKRVYIKPESKVYPMPDEPMLKPTSIELDVPRTKEEDWDEDEFDLPDTQI